MTANAFGVAHCTISVVFRKVCDIISNVLGAKYIKLSPTVQEIKELITGFWMSGWHTYSHCATM